MEVAVDVFEESFDKMNTTYSETTVTVMARREEPNEEICVGIFDTLEDRFGVQHLAAGRRRESKKRTRGDCGS